MKNEKNNYRTIVPLRIQKRGCPTVIQQIRKKE